jgi:hypothetical protein
MELQKAAGCHFGKCVYNKRQDAASTISMRLEDGATKSGRMPLLHFALKVSSGQ